MNGVAVVAIFMRPRMYVNGVLRPRPVARWILPAFFPGCPASLGVAHLTPPAAVCHANAGPFSFRHPRMPQARARPAVEQRKAHAAPRHFQTFFFPFLPPSRSRSQSAPVRPQPLRDASKQDEYVPVVVVWHPVCNGTRAALNARRLLCRT